MPKTYQKKLRRYCGISFLICLMWSGLRSRVSLERPTQRTIERGSSRRWATKCSCAEWIGIDQLTLFNSLCATHKGEWILWSNPTLSFFALIQRERSRLPASAIAPLTVRIAMIVQQRAKYESGTTVSALPALSIIFCWLLWTSAFHEGATSAETTGPYIKLSGIHPSLNL